MPVPPPMHDPSHVETRLLVLAELLERAVQEVRRAMVDIRSGPDGIGTTPPEPDPAGEPDGS
jgi:hypothetical protein